MTVADPGFPVGGRGGGAPMTDVATSRKNVCEYERIGSCRGGREGGV